VNLNSTLKVYIDSFPMKHLGVHEREMIAPHPSGAE